jgi:hypothetical protein
MSALSRPELLVFCLLESIRHAVKYGNRTDLRGFGFIFSTIFRETISKRERFAVPVLTKMASTPENGHSVDFFK